MTRTQCKRCHRWFVVRFEGGGKPRYYCSLECESLARAARYQAKPPARSERKTFDAMRRKGEL